MTTTPPDVLVLLAVRLRGRGDAAAVSTTFTTLGGGSDEADTALAGAVRRGQVRVRGDERRYSLTPAGTTTLAGALAARLDADERARCTALYEAFLPINRAFLAALQVREVPVDVVQELVDDLGPLLDDLTARLDRFASYRPRFARALELAPFDPAWITAPDRDSVHTVWFELHEHLLATLGRDRTSER